MSKPIYRLLAGVLCVILLSGCGFHLRGSQNRDLHLKQLQLSPDRPFDKTYQTIRQQLLAQGLVISTEANAPILVVEPKLFQVHVLAYGRDGQVRRERLTYQLKFKVQKSDGTLIIPETEVTSERDRLLNPSQDLGDAYEKQLLEQEMLNDAISQMAHFLVF